MYNLIVEDRKLLSVPCDRFNFDNPPVAPDQLAKDMIDFMYKNNGIGLAANQIGLNYRVFAMRGTPEDFVLFNPKIVEQSEEQIVLEEGCLSFPNLYIKIKRPRHVTVRFLGPDGEGYTKQFTGMTARIVLHEMDHLDGVLFFDRANYYHRDKAFKDQKLITKRKEKANV